MGNTIFGGLGPGLGQDINPFDPNFQRKVLFAKNQQQADDANARAIATYTSAAANVKAQNVQLQAAGQPLLSLAPPPHKKMLDANGNIVDSTELVCPAISVIPDPPSPNAVSTGGVPVATTGIPMDRTDLLLLMLRALKQDIDAIKAKVGA